MHTQITGYVTLRDLDYIANDVVALCNKHGLRAVWKGKGRSIIAKIMGRDGIVWTKTYTEKYWHQNMAMMYAGLHDYLHLLDKKWKLEQERIKRERQEREEEARIAAMPSWEEKIKQQRNLK